MPPFTWKYEFANNTVLYMDWLEVRHDAVIARLESTMVPIACQLRSASKVASACYDEVQHANHDLQHRMSESDPRRFVCGFDHLLREVCDNKYFQIHI